jgi:peptidoglycan/LPS O-acetylase OafA/YrhL
MTTAVSTTASTRPASATRRRRALVVAGAALAPSSVWLLAQATSTDLTVTLAGQPPMTISLPFVVVTAMAAGLVGWAALVVAQRTTRHPRTTWTCLALAALLGSFGPLAIAETSTTTRTFLALMHVAVAAVLIVGLRGTVAAHVPTNAERSHA